MAKAEEIPKARKRLDDINVVSMEFRGQFNIV
jgi:hypothetical protein